MFRRKSVYLKEKGEEEQMKEKGTSCQICPAKVNIELNCNNNSEIVFSLSSRQSQKS